MSVEAIQDLETKATAIRADMTALDTKAGGMTADDRRTFVEKSIELKGVKAELEARATAGEFDQWSARSRGTVPLVAGGGRGVAAVADVDSFVEDSAVTFFRDDTGERAFRIADGIDGPIYDPTVPTAIRSADYKRAFRDYMRLRPHMPMSPQAYRALNEATDVAGGYMVPEEIMNKIIQKEPTPTRVQGRVQQFTTSRDNILIPAVRYTTDDTYTTGMRATFAGETPATSTTARVTDPTFGQERVQVFTATMSILITRDIVEDAAFDLMGWLAMKFGETAELLRDNMILNGTGIGQPMGILANPSDTTNFPKIIKTGTNAVLGTGGASGTIQTLFNKVAFDIPEQYDQNCCWVMSKTTTGQNIASFVDGNGRPLWGNLNTNASLADGYIGRPLAGYPVVYSAFMPTYASTGNLPIFFGDLSGYYMVNRVGFSVEVYRELYVETNQILVLGRIRFGGKPAEPWRMRLVQASA